MLTYGSVCSGIEAASAAWHPLGMRPLWFSEIERFPSAVLAHRWPEVPNHGDFTRLIQVPPAGVDVLVGGTPCQAFSVAGLRGGLSDPRGNLALAFVALVDALRPRWVVWENVPGVLSSGGGRDFGSFLGGLAELGYGWAYRVLDAQYFGLAQRRQRVFVVASPGDWHGPAQVLFEPESVRRDSPPRRQAGAGVAGALGTGASGGGGWRVGADEAAAGHVVPAGHGYVAAAEVAGTLCNNGKAAGSATQQDAETGMLVAYGGNNPGPLDVATACNAKVGAGRMDFESETFIAHTLRAEGHDASEDGTGRGVPLVPVTVTSSGRGWWDESDRAATLRAQDSPTKADTLAVHAFDARLPDAGVPVAYQCHGSNVGEMGTLRAGNGGVTGGGPFIATAPHERRGVRRLMPHELERLQGFPDHYTLLPNQQRKAVEDDYAAWYAERFPGMTREQIERLSKDGPRAKALGNSMAVPVMRWIGERVLLVDAMRRGG